MPCIVRQLLTHLLTWGFVEIVNIRTETHNQVFTLVTFITYIKKNKSKTKFANRNDKI